MYIVLQEIKYLDLAYEQFEICTAESAEMIPIVITTENTVRRDLGS